MKIMFLLQKRMGFCSQLPLFALIRHSYSVEDIISLVGAAEKNFSPLIIELPAWAVISSQSSLVTAAAQAAEKATVLISVHLDNCQDEALLKSACELPFDSIRIDLSQYSQRDKLRYTNELVSYCHSRGIATEVQVDHAGSGEGGAGALTNSIEMCLRDEEYVGERVSLTISDLVL